VLRRSLRGLPPFAQIHPFQKFEKAKLKIHRQKYHGISGWNCPRESFFKNTLETSGKDLKLNSNESTSPIYHVQGAWSLMYFQELCPPNPIRL
jgi:hypothetical protein